jgi:hypothetical protein
LHIVKIAVGKHFFFNGAHAAGTLVTENKNVIVISAGRRLVLPVGNIFLYN